MALFNQKLSAVLRPADRDAIWAAASMLGVITFASIEAPTPEKSWPLAPSMSAEPEWLKMGHGKDALLRLAKPDRPDSIFHTLLSTMPTIELSMANVPPGFMRMYQLDGLSMESSPYALPLVVVFAPWDPDRQSSALVFFYTFNTCLRKEFGRLVLDKDPQALLVMACWYSRICTGPWWIRRRAFMEGRATCLYLEKHYPHDGAVHDLLKAPQDNLFKRDL